MATRSVSEVLSDLEIELKKAHEFIAQLAAPPNMIGTILSVTDNDVVVVRGMDRLVVEKPKIEVHIGDMVKLNEQAQIVDTLTMHTEITDIGTVCHCVAVKGDFLEVEMGGAVREILRGKLQKVEEGDRVIVDNSGNIALKNVGQEERFNLDQDIQVQWKDVGGQGEAVKALKAILEIPTKYPELVKAYGWRSSKGVLLSGPPGCGKTLLGKASANALAKLYKKEKGGFLYVKGPEILNMFIGQSEQNVRQVFANARKFHKTKGHPALLFIDEADAIFRKRGTSISSDILDTVVPAALAEMDGLEELGAVVMIATNRPDLLDPAITRDGRIDKKVEIKRPDKKGSHEILSIYVDKISVFKDEANTSVKRTVEFIFSDTLPLLTCHYKDGRQEKLFLRDVVSGAMLEGVVQKATLTALQRDVDEKVAKATGVTQDDLLEAVGQAWRENLSINHDDTIKEKWGGMEEEIAKITRMKVAA